jgi:hypothetical protein
MKQFFSKGLNIRLSIFFIFISIFLVIHSCKKDTSHTAGVNGVPSSPDKILVTDAKNYFDKYIIPTGSKAVDQSLSGNNTKTLRQAIEKTAAWARAYTQTFDFGKSVIVPVSYAQDLYIHKGNYSIALSSLTWLFVYTDKTNKMHAELVTKIPDAACLNSTDSTKAYTGILYVEDFFGNFIKGYEYLDDGTVQHISAPTKFVKSNGKLQVATVTCTWTDYYTCTSSGGNNYGCTYSSSSEAICVENEGNGPASGPSSQVYQFIGGGGGSGTGTGGGGTPGNPGCPPVVNESINNDSYTVNSVPCDVPKPPTQPPVIATIIVDSLKKHFPCAVALIINKLAQIGVYSNLTQAFTTTKKPNLIWQDAILLWNVPVPNSTQKTYQLGNTGYDGRSATITLNTSMLKNSTKLMIASAAIHETLHAFINYNVQSAVGGFNTNGSWLYALDTWATVNGLPGNYSDHYQMLTDYFSQAVTALKAWDSGAHTDEQYEMTMLYGLDNANDGTAAQKALLQQEYNNLLTKYGITASALSDYWKTQLTPTSSTDQLPTSGCPTN